MTKEEKDMERMFLQDKYVRLMKESESFKDITEMDIMFSLFPRNWFLLNAGYDDDKRIELLKEAMARNMTVLALVELREDEIEVGFKK